MRGIYKISNNINDKVYIGKSENIYRRWNEHETMLRNGKHHSWKLQEFYNENVSDLKLNFEILEDVGILENLEDFEFKWVNEYKAIECGYNVAQIKSDSKVKIKTPRDRKIKMIRKDNKFVISLIYENGLKIKSEFKDFAEFCNLNKINLEIYGEIDDNLKFRTDEFLEIINSNLKVLSKFNDYMGITVFKTNGTWEMYIGISISFVDYKIGKEKIIFNVFCSNINDEDLKPYQYNKFSEFKENTENEINFYLNKLDRNIFKIESKPPNLMMSFTLNYLMD